MSHFKKVHKIFTFHASQVLADSFNALSALLPIMSFEAIDLKQFRFVIVLFRKY